MSVPVTPGLWDPETGASLRLVDYLPSSRGSEGYCPKRRGQKAIDQDG